MKTITIKQKKKSVVLQWSYLTLFVMATTASFAQVQTNGSLFIGDGAMVYVGSGNYAFGAGGATQTSRAAAYGKLIFESGATSSGASDGHFLNGYGSIRTTSPFTFPLGQSGVYAPARVTPSSTAAVDAAYVRASATTIGATLDVSVSAVSATEYWNIKGTNNAVITLSWGVLGANSGLSTMGITPSAANLTIVGYDGAKWVKIPSTVDATSILGGTSAVATGSITSNTAVDLNDFEFFSLGTEILQCAPIVAASGPTKIWTGSWSPAGTPTETDVVQIDTPFAGSLVCNSLVLNADITLTGTQSVEIVNGATGSGKIVMASETSVVQRNPASSAPNIVLTKKSRSVMRRFDYIYWGTPIAGDFFSQLSGAQASTATLADAFDAKYKYVSGTGTTTGWQNLTAIETGKGFITRIKEQAPFTNGTNTDFINLTFTGVANNGNVVVPITNDPSFPNAGKSHVLLANPYPSAIDADKFLEENTNIDGAVYIWTAATANSGTEAYAQADYIAYTRAGFVLPNAIAATFNGKIASGQGFKVKSLTTAGNVTFTNCMRLTTDNTSFFKTKQQSKVQTDSYKLNMTGANGVFSQILVSYLPEATLGYDRMYDAGRNSVSTAQLFSIFEGDGSRLAINARPAFDASDIVSLGVAKATTTAETFTIAITEKDGVFNTGQSVYIFDTLTNTYHDLSKGNFSFTTNQANLDRYKLTYQAGTLSNPDFESFGVKAALSNNTISMTADTALTAVVVYELTGRKILESKIDNTLSYSAPFQFPKAVYVVKAFLNNGTVASFKLINKN